MSLFYGWRAWAGVYVLFSAATAAAGVVLTEIVLRLLALTPLMVAWSSSVVGAVVVLVPAVMAGKRGWRHWPGRDWARLIAAGGAIYAAGFVLLFNGIDRIGSSKATLLARLETIFVVALAMLFLAERWSRLHWIATVTAVAGAVLVNFDPAAWQFQFGLGEMLTILSALVVAAGIVVIKPLLDRHDGQLVTGGGLLIGAAWMAPCLFWPATLDTAVSDGPVKSLWLVLSLLVARGALLGVSWLTYNLAMVQLGASRCSMLFLTVVFFTVIMQLLVDAARPTLGLHVPANLPTAVCGGLVIVAGIAVLPREADEPQASMSNRPDP